jgi:hypothetical protein
MHTSGSSMPMGEGIFHCYLIFYSNQPQASDYQLSRYLAAYIPRAAACQWEKDFSTATLIFIPIKPG